MQQQGTNGTTLASGLREASDLRDNTCSRSGKDTKADMEKGGGEEEAGKRKGPSWLRPAGQQGPAVATLLPGSHCL